MSPLDIYREDAAKVAAKRLALLVKAVSRFPKDVPVPLLEAAADAIAEGRARVKELLQAPQYTPKDFMRAP